jgi:membrane-associated protease RseP (regulator of RpoE activity)
VQTTSRNGLLIESLTPQLAEYFGVKRGEGVLVRGVERGSPAAQAGLKAGDVIVSVDKEQISDVSDWRRVMRGKSGNVSVGIIREKRQQSVPLKLPARTREQGEMISPDHFIVGDLDIDIDTDQLNKQLDLIKPQIEQQRHLIAMELEAQRPQIEKALNEAKHIQCEELEKARKAMEKIDVEQIKREAEKNIDHAQLEKEMAQLKSELAKIDVQKLKADFSDSKEFEKMQQEIQKQMKELQKDLREQQEQFHMISY